MPWREGDGSDSNSSTIAHGRNFIECVKSRSKPVSDLEVGFYASLPCLLAVKAVREGRSFRWDDAGKKAVAVVTNRAQERVEPRRPVRGAQ